MHPIASPTLVHEFEPIQTQGTIELDNNNLCVDDDMFVVEEDKTNMIAP